MKTVCIFTETKKHTQQQMKTGNEHTKKESELSPLLTIDEVMVRLSVSRHTVYKLTKAGKLPLIKLLNCSRYKSEDVEKLLVPQK